MNPRLTVLLFALVTAFVSAGRSAVIDDVELNDVEEFTYKGIQVLLRPSKNVPSVTAILYIKGGTSVLKSEDEVAREYMAMNLVPGSPEVGMSKQFFRRRMLRMGSGIGGSDGRDFSVLTLRSLRENFDTTWKYFVGKLLRPTIDSVEFINLKRNALVGLTGGRTNPEQYAKLIGDSVYFQNHPYGIRLTREAVERTDRTSILDHFKRSLVRSRLLLVVVGNISRSELENKLDRSGLESLPMGEYSDPVIPIPPKSLSPTAVFPPYDRKLPTKYVRGYFRIPPPGHPDYYPYIRLSRFFGGFLFQHLRVQTNLSYAPDLNEVESRESYGIISFETTMVDSAVRMVHRDIDFFQKNTLLESAIRGGVNRYTTSTLMKQESTVEIASNLGRAQILTGSWRNAFFNYDRLATVKPEDINRVANTYLRNITWVVIGDTRDVDKSLLESR